MKFLKIIVLIFCFASCAPIYVNYDYEKATDFSEYRTFNFFTDMETGLSELDEKRFINALKSNLELMGLSYSETPSFLIDINSNEYIENSRNTVGVGVGGSGRNMGGGISIGLPIGRNKTSRQIIVDFVDDSKTGLFWQAKSESNFNANANPEKREARLNAIAQKIVSKFPPKKK